MVMNYTARARKMLESTSQRSRMYASNREALLSRVSAILELVGVDNCGSSFYERHTSNRGSIPTDLAKDFDDAWAQSVTQDALHMLDEHERGMVAPV